MPVFVFDKLTGFTRLLRICAMLFDAAGAVFPNKILTLLRETQEAWV
jgi:hypothetical protein